MGTFLTPRNQQCSLSFREKWQREREIPSFVAWFNSTLLICRFPIGRATRTKTGVTWTSMHLSSELAARSMHTTTTRTRAASTWWTPRDRSVPCTGEGGSSAVDGEGFAVDGIPTKTRETRTRPCRCSARPRRTRRGEWNHIPSFFPREVFRTVWSALAPDNTCLGQ